MTRRSLAIRSGALLFGALLTMAASRPARAGTCTLQPRGLSIFAVVPSAGGNFSFGGDTAPFAIPMDVDAQGTVTVTRDAIPDANIDTQGGPVTVKLAGQTVTGTLDAAGNMSLPGFNVDTLFGMLDLLTNPTLTTVPQVVNLRGTDYATQGVALDFTTGIVTLTGGDIVPDAPVVSEPVISGVRITCKLDPIPDQSRLPHAPTLMGLHGAATGSAHDTLTFKASVAAKRPTVDLKHQDVVVRLLTGAGAEIVTVSSTVQTSQDGSNKTSRTLTVSTPKDKPAPAPDGAKLRIRGSKRRATITLRLPGVDLSALDGAVKASVAVGPNAVTVSAVARNGKLTAH